MTRALLRWLGAVLALAALAAGLAVVALAVGATLDPTSSYYATMASSLWTTFGPHFTIVAILAFVVGLVATWLGARVLGRAAMLAAAIASVAAIYIVGSVVAAASAAGGSVSPLSALTLGKMTEPPPDAVETFATVEGKDLKVAIYLPADKSKPGPVFTYIHGGGFMIGTNTETAHDLRWFADRGWVVFSIDYRVFTPGNPTWDKAPADVACGLAWIRANASRFGADPTRLVLLGDSAGGNLAINLAYGAATGAVQTSCGPIAPPEAVVVQYPAVDPVATYERGFPAPGFEPAMLMAGYVGGTPEQFPERIKAISSATYISAKAPPTLIIEPEKDGLVVSDGVYKFADEASAAGVDVELVRIPFANHIYNQIAANSLGNQARLTITQHYFEKKGLAP